MRHIRAHAAQGWLLPHRGKIPTIWERPQDLRRVNMNVPRCNLTIVLELLEHHPLQRKRDSAEANCAEDTCVSERKLLPDTSDAVTASNIQHHSSLAEKDAKPQVLSELLSYRGYPFVLDLQAGLPRISVCQFAPVQLLQWHWLRSLQLPWRKSCFRRSEQGVWHCRYEYRTETCLHQS